MVDAADTPFEREADRVADHVVAQLSGQAMGARPPITPLQEETAQRKCAACEVDDKQLQRKGGSGPVTTQEVELNPSGGEPLPDTTRHQMEGAFGEPFGAVRIHQDGGADRSAQDLSARAYTVGNHIYFGSGQFQPDTPQGNHLLAHELTHVVQQGGMARRAQAKCTACEAEEKQQDQGAGSVHIQRGILDSLPSLPSPSDIVDAGRSAIGAGVELAEDVGSGIATGARAVGRGLVTVAETGVELVGGIAQELWDAANAFASILGGGSISVSGTSLIVSVPGPVPICPSFAVQFPLPGIAEKVPIGFGTVPLGTSMFASGLLSAFVRLTPELSGQLGPCTLSGVRITIDPFGPSFSASGSFSATAALGLGAALDVGLHGDVMILILWPDPPAVLIIPYVGLEAGLEGFARGIIATRVTASGGMGYSSGAFSLNVIERQTLGLALDLGAAGFGELQFLGQNLCRVYWPLLAWHADTAIDSGFDVNLYISRSRASASLSLYPPTLNPVGFGNLGIMIPRDMFTDDCPLCGLLYRAGLMPSQLGGSWHSGSPGPRHPGPLLVYPNDPRIASGSKCRGACGPNCDTCVPSDDPTDHKHTVCVENKSKDGVSHYFWVYPNFHHCNTHRGCREHDACYDWTAKFGETGPLGILGTVHRLCDLEAICNYGLKQSVGWIGGKPPYDGGMEFSDYPYQTGECPGPCPDEREADETAIRRICLPEYVIFEEYPLLEENFHEETGYVQIFEIPVEVPYIPVPVLVSLWANGGIDANASAAIGPLTLENVCLNIDTVTGSHTGTARVRLTSDLFASLELFGDLELQAGWGCLLGFIDTTVVSGNLDLSAFGAISLQTDLIGDAEVECQQGKIVLSTALTLEPCLALKLAVYAAIRAMLFHRFELFSRRWKLASWEWDDCWSWELFATSTPLGDWDFDLSFIDMDMVELLSSMLSDGNSTTPGAGRSPNMPADPARRAGIANPCKGKGDDDEPPTPPPSGHVPTGLTRDDPIDMTWYKPKSEYPQTCSLAVQEGGNCVSNSDCSAPTPSCTTVRIGNSDRQRCTRQSDYPLDRPTTLPALTRQFAPIDVGVAYYPSTSDVIELTPTPRSGTAQANFNRRFARHGHNLGTHSEQPDHVLDLDWHGVDDHTNLWPLDSDLNQAAGRIQNLNQRVTFSEGPSGPVHTNMTLRTFKQQGFHQRNPPHKFFRIASVTRP